MKLKTNQWHQPDIKQNYGWLCIKPPVDHLKTVQWWEYNLFFFWCLESYAFYYMPTLKPATSCQVISIHIIFHMIYQIHMRDIVILIFTMWGNAKPQKLQGKTNGFGDRTEQKWTWIHQPVAYQIRSSVLESVKLMELWAWEASVFTSWLLHLNLNRKGTTCNRLTFAIFSSTCKKGTMCSC